MHDLKISSKGFRIDSPQAFTDYIMTMSFIWIKIFYDFCNVIFSNRDRRKTVICSFKRISRKLASIIDYSALFSKKIVKDLSFLFEISIVIIIMINWWNTRYVNI